MSSRISSSALSLASSYVLLGIAALVLFAVPLWYAWHVTLKESRAEILTADAQRLSDLYRRDGGAGLKNFIDARVGMQIANERILLLTDSELHPLAGNLERWPAGVPAAAGNYSTPVITGSTSQSALVHVAALDGYRLLVGRDNAILEPLLTRFWYSLGGAVAVLCIAGLLIGLMTRRALMRRIDGIANAVSAIIHGDLKQRLPQSSPSSMRLVHAKEDELDTLARTINGMLDQIELLVNGVRNVSNSIAHDLRTPLAELRSRLEEVSLIRPGAEATYAEIDGAVADIDRVIRIFDALLRLAEIDAGMRRSGFIRLDIADVAANAVEFYQPAAELKGIAIDYRGAGRMWVSGDPVLLAQALANLLDNCLKYAPQEGVIQVRVQRRSDGAAQVSVTDNGPGVRAAEKPKVLQRFYRGDASRGTPGVGLGLSLVQSVAKLHGGALELTDVNPGLCVALSLPALTSHEAAPLSTGPGPATGTAARVTEPAIVTSAH